MEQHTGVIRTTTGLYLYSENASYQIIRKIKPKSVSLLLSFSVWIIFPQEISVLFTISHVFLFP